MNKLEKINAICRNFNSTTSDTRLDLTAYIDLSASPFHFFNINCKGKPYVQFSLSNDFSELKTMAFGEEATKEFGSGYPLQLIQATVKDILDYLGTLESSF